MITTFVLSQILAASAFVCGLSAYQFKNRKYTLLLLSVAQLSTSLHFFLLNATTAGFVILLSALRFFIAIWFTRLFVRDIFIILVLAVGIFTFANVYDLIPIMAGILGTLGAFAEEGKKMRFYFMAGGISILIFNVIIFSPVSIAAGLFYFGSNLLSYWRFYIRKGET